MFSSCCSIKAAVMNVSNSVRTRLHLFTRARGKETPFADWACKSLHAFRELTLKNIIATSVMNITFASYAVSSFHTLIKYFKLCSTMHVSK